MDQEAINDSLDQHLDGVEGILKWALAIAVVVAWAGRHGDPKIKLLGLTTSRGDAYLLSAGAFILANVALYISFLRLGDLISSLEESGFPRAIEKLMTHHFLLNPFAYFGPTFTARFHSSLGYGLLIICWWICNTAIATLRPSSSLVQPIEIIFLGIGLLSMGAITRCFRLISLRAEKFDPTLAAQIRKTKIERAIASLLSVGVGSAIYWVFTR